MSTWKRNLLAAPTRVWIALSFVLGLAIGLVAGIGWAVSGLVFGLLLGVVVGAALASALLYKRYQRLEADRAGTLIRIASSLREGETPSALQALEHQFNWRLGVSVWNRDIARLPQVILENWQNAKVYYGKYKPAGEKIPTETYNVLTYLEQVPWSEREAARREFDGAFKAGQPHLAPELARADVRTWINTEPITLQDLRGKVVLLDFWGTRCRPCVAALPDLQKLFSDYFHQGFMVIGITAGETESRIRAFLDSGQFTFPVCVAIGNNLWYKYAVEGTPTYFLIDKKGLLVWGPSHSLPDRSLILGLL
jgi:thiol-disulfide isomerase/thioredoxin